MYIVPFSRKIIFSESISQTKLTRFRLKFYKNEMKLAFGFILSALFCVARGDLPKKVHPIIKVSDFICHTDGIRSSLKRYLASEHLDNPIDTMMFEQARKFAHELDTNKNNTNNQWREFETKILTGVFMTFGSLDVEEFCSANPSAQLHEIISKFNFESVDPTMLKNGIARFLAIITKTPVDQTLQWIEMDIKQGEELKCKRGGEKKSEKVHL